MSLRCPSRTCARSSPTLRPFFFQTGPSWRSVSGIIAPDRHFGHKRLQSPRGWTCYSIFLIHVFPYWRHEAVTWRADWQASTRCWCSLILSGGQGLDTVGHPSQLNEWSSELLTSYHHFITELPWSHPPACASQMHVPKVLEMGHMSAHGSSDCAETAEQQDS
jgi:hypothetical protein